MKISNEGVVIKYKNFTIIYRWPILQTFFFQRRFYIPELQFDSNSFWDCLVEIARPNKPVKVNGHYQKAKKVTGLTDYDVYLLYASSFFENSCGVMIWDIRVLDKPYEFWQKVPNEYKKEFLRDMVLLKCDSQKEVQRLIEALPDSFCEAYGYVNGKRIYDNLSI